MKDNRKESEWQTKAVNPAESCADTVQQVISYIEDRLLEDLSPGLIAEHFYISVSSLNLMFKTVCGGIGGGAQMALAQAGIKLFGGVQGDADKAAESYASGTLSYDPNAKCDHHDHNHEDGHSCGEHACKNSGCGSHND